MQVQQTPTRSNSNYQSPQERYHLIEERAWSWYERNISYNVIKTGVEFVTLTGRHEGKQVVKIPALRDTWEFRKKVEEEFGVRITKYMFSCDFSMFHENIKYKVYLYSK